MEQKTPKKTILHSRGEFLNLPGFHSDATIFTRVVYTENTNKYDRINTSCQIRDCNHTINLAIDTDNQEEFDNTIHKINLLIRTLKDFRLALKKANRMRIKEEEKERNNDKQQETNPATTNIPT